MGIKVRILVVEITHVVLTRIHWVNIARFLEQFDEFPIGKNEIIGAGGRLGDECQHVVATGIVLGLDLDVVHGFKLFNHIGLTMPVPGNHVQFSCGVSAWRHEDHRHAKRAGSRDRAGAFQDFPAACVRPALLRD